MSKILFLVPHVSTGGLPQYLFKKLELIKNDYDVHVIVWADIAPIFDVQRKRLNDLLGTSRFNVLNGSDNQKVSFIKNFIEKESPDIIHLEEIPEMWLYNDDILKYIYRSDRNYRIVETTHDSSFDIKKKRWFPDQFAFVSKWSIEQFSQLNIPMELVEYPIEYRLRPNRESSLKELGLDPSYKHVLNVGLFSSRKNQKEIIEYAKRMLDEKIIFHFVGNQADNFKWYWEPLLKDLPNNCKVWGERSDVDKFYSSMDLFLFTSLGKEGDKETNPLVIKEALSWRMPVLLYNLDVYMNKYKDEYGVRYLSNNMLDNIALIKDELQLNGNILEEILSKRRLYWYDDVLCGNLMVNRLFGLKDLCDKYLSKESVMCEIGSFAGVSSELFANYVKEIHCIDKWELYSEIGDSYMIESESEFDKLLDKYSNIKKVKLDSTEASKLYPDDYFDLIYIDAAHDYKSIYNDIKNWLPKIKNGGIISGHDYNLDDVKKAVNEWFINIETFSDSSWLVVKNEINYKKRKVYDCFMFNNELDLLELRLNELDPYIDKFILIESKKTHTLLDKPLYYLEHKEEERFKKFQNKIIHLTADFNSDDAWNNEYTHANTIFGYIKENQDLFNENDIIHISHLDEVPDFRTIDLEKITDDIYFIDSKMYYYYFNNLFDSVWQLSFITTIKKIKEFNDIYLIRLDYPKNNIIGKGWHFSYLGNKEHIKQKLLSFSHTELSDVSLETIEECIEKNTDLFGRIDIYGNDYVLTYVDLDESFPKYLLENKDRYRDYIYNDKYEKAWYGSLKYGIQQKKNEFLGLLKILDKLEKKENILEIGFYDGGTSYGFLQIFKNVYSIDISEEKEIWKEIKQEYPNWNYYSMDTHKEDTKEFIRNLGIKFDCIFIDGDHSYEGVKQDYEMYKEFLSENGIICFHDILDTESHRNCGCYVHMFWNEIKECHKTTEIIDDIHNIEKWDLKNSEWGGIGIILNPNITKAINNLNLPLISIIMPTHGNNYFNLIRAIDSVINQTYDKWELIICDDFENEYRKELIKSYKDKRIYYYNINNNENGYASEKRYISTNKYANGDLICFLDDDNILYENYCEKMVENFYKNIGMVICKIDYENERPNYILPEKNSIILGKIDALNFMVRKEFILGLKWNGNVGDDYEILKELEQRLYINNLKINFIDNILAKHCYKIDETYFNNLKKDIYIFSYNYLGSPLWYDILKNQLNLLYTSKLYYHTKKIFLYFYINNENNENWKNDFYNLINFYDKDRKIEIYELYENKHEYQTLIKLHEFAKSNNDVYLLYFHLKGVISSNIPQNIGVSIWRESMEYYNIIRWFDCIKKLEENYDIVGIHKFYYQEPNGTFGNIFSGNFWWANGEYIKKLPELEFDINQPTKNEFWVTQIPNNSCDLLFENIKKVPHLDWKTKSPYLNPFRYKKDYRDNIFNINDLYVRYIFDENKFYFDYINPEKIEEKEYYVDICDLSSNISLYKFLININVQYWAVPFSIDSLLYQTYYNKTSGYLIRVSDKDDNILLGEKIISLKSVDEKVNRMYYCNKDDHIIDPYLDYLYNDIYGNFIDNCKIVIDAGANVGTFIHYVLVKNSSIEKIIAIEAIESNCKNIRNTFSDIENLEVINKALYSDDGKTIDFSVFKYGSEGSFISELNENCVCDEKIKVGTISLNSILKSYDAVDLLKLDIEGAEYKVFECVDDSELLKVNKIILEFHNNYENQIDEIIIPRFKKLGYLCSFTPDMKTLDFSMKEHPMSTIFIQKINTIKNDDYNGTIATYHHHHNNKKTDNKIPIYIFSHNYLVNNWYEIVENQLKLLIESGLYENSNKITFGVYGNDEEFEKFNKLVYYTDYEKKCNIVRHLSNDGELRTIHLLYQYAKECKENEFLLYFHTKGVDSENRININKNAVRAWRTMMEYFTIERWRDAVDKLKNYDIVGACYFKVVEDRKFSIFAGNFWWTKSDYVKTLYDISEKFNLNDRWFAENYICSNISHKEYNLFEPNDKGLYYVEVDNYRHESKLVNYIDSNIEKNKNIDYNDVFIVSSHPNYKATNDITLDCIKSLKKSGKKVILTTHCPISKELQESVDYFIYDKNNPLIVHDFFVRSWFEFPQYYCEINLTKNQNNLNHAVGVLINYYNGLILANELGFKIAHCINFDIVVSEEDLQVFENIKWDMLRENKKGYFMNTKEQEGMTLKTIFFSINPAYFIEKFTYPLTEEIYLQEKEKNNSETNCLENYVYNNLKHNLDDLILKETTDEILFSKSKVNLFSMIEYFTVIPLNQGVSSEFVIWFSSSNKVDDRELYIKVIKNGTMILDEKENITNWYQYYRTFKYDHGDIFEIRCIVKNTIGEILKDKTIVIKDYNEILDNGKFHFKNK